MKLEHIGLAVPAAQAMADWYVQHLGFSARFRGGDDRDGVAFVSDPQQDVMLELISNPVVPPPDWKEWAPLTLHFAFRSADPLADAARLEAAGASFIERNARTPNTGDILILMRDPWGNVIQLVKRSREL